jgi:MYXO-CTERM domain-containing protein
MTTLAQRLASAVAVATVTMWVSQAQATPTLYSSNCAGCHSQTTNTCDGCHAHGTHSSSAKSNINVAGTTDKTSYAPGSSVKVTVNGGYQSGWVRLVLFDQNLAELARSTCPGGTGGCTTTAFPVTLTATAPTTPGTYIWAVAWYGHNYDINGASFGSGNSSTLKAGYFTPDVNNTNHGYQTVALPAFTVSAASGPVIALNPTSLNFQTVTVGSSKTLTTQVQNTGTAALNVSGVSSCAGTPASVRWSPTASFSVAAGGSATLSVTFAPTAAGALPAGACLTIASNDPAKPTVNLGVSGTGATASAPAIALNPSSLNFQTVTVGSSKTLTTQVQNTGTAALNVSGVSSCTGTPASVTWSPTASFSVTAGGSATLSLTFVPTSAGALPAGACLTIASNDPAKPTVNLGVSGTGATASAPAIALNPASLTFQTVVSGTSKTLAAQVQNTGTASLNVAGVSSCPGTPGSITWTPAGTFSVAAGANASLNVTFAPMVAGALPAGACLAIASNDPAHPTVDLGITGTATSVAGPAIFLDPASLDFQTVGIGDSRTLTAQLHNVGSTALQVTSIALCGGTPSVVSWSGAATPASVPPGASIALGVLYAPTSPGALPAGSCIAIASNDPANATVQLRVSGTGANGFLTMQPPSIGCSSAGGADSLVGLAALLLLGVRRSPPRRRTEPSIPPSA